MSSLKESLDNESSLLFDSSRHEHLTETEWCTDSVEAEISRIIDDIGTSAKDNASWPTHSLDGESYSNSGPKWAMYAGAAGVVLGLQILGSYGYKTNNFNHRLANIYSSYLKRPDVQVEPGLQLGEIGILMPAILAQSDDPVLENSLLQNMKKTIDLPLYEITSGQSGMMHAALGLYRKTGKECWRELYIQGADSLMKHWKLHSDSGQWLWQSKVFGPSRHYYGACHGIAGNANILLRGVDLLEDDIEDLIIERTVSTLKIAAKKNSGMSNWALCTKPDIEKLLVQWCHGAAGIVTALAATPKSGCTNSTDLENLLKTTGELVWNAGPLGKGSNICHGTSGNGYAFLYLYKRWKDRVWLDRARRFAMHAIEQCQRDRESYGQGRYSLWTGDVGLAIYLHHYLYPDEAAIPGLDLF